MFPMALLIAFALPLTASSKIWIVDDDGPADFADLQPALDAVSPGDVLVVREGLYRRFKTAKGVTIVGAGKGRTVVREIDDAAKGTVWFDAVPGQQRVVVSSLTAEGFYPVNLGNSSAPHVVNEVEIVLHGAPWFVGSLSAFKAGSVFVQSCYNVLVDPSLTYGGGGMGGYLSTMSVSGCTMVSDNSFIGYEGGAGYGTTSSTLYLANCTGTAGTGGVGHWGGLYCDESYPGGIGGHGVKLQDSTGLIAGAGHILQGGAGGDGGTDGICPGQSPGGNGGFGVFVEGTGSAIVSNMDLRGGPGGQGNPDGDPGLPYSDHVTVLSTPLPTSTVEGDGALGSVLTFKFLGQPGDQATMILASEVGILKPWGTDGFPLMAVPGGLFLVIPLGTFDASGVKTASGTIAQDDTLRGYALFAQAVVTSPSRAHPPQITNLSLAVVKEP